MGETGNFVRAGCVPARSMFCWFRNVKAFSLFVLFGPSKMFVAFKFLNISK